MKKIISLESIGFTGHIQSLTTGERVPVRRKFKVGEGYRHRKNILDGDEGPKITAISLEFILPDGCSVNDGCYEIRTDDGHAFTLPLNAYIAEWQD